MGIMKAPFVMLSVCLFLLLFNRLELFCFVFTSWLVSFFEFCTISRDPSDSGIFSGTPQDPVSCIIKIRETSRVSLQVLWFSVG